MVRSNHENVYAPKEKLDIANEFSPALAEVLETVAPAWGNKVIVESSNVERVEPSNFSKIRQLGDKGLVAAMRLLGKM